MEMELKYFKMDRHTEMNVLGKKKRSPARIDTHRGSLLFSFLDECVHLFIMTFTSLVDSSAFSANYLLASIFW